MDVNIVILHPNVQVKHNFRSHTIILPEHKAHNDKGKWKLRLAMHDNDYRVDRCRHDWSIFQPVASNFLLDHTFQPCQIHCTMHIYAAVQYSDVQL